MTKVTTSQTEKRKAITSGSTWRKTSSFRSLTTGLECYAFKHQALPDLDPVKISIQHSRCSGEAGLSIVNLIV